MKEHKIQSALSCRAFESGRTFAMCLALAITSPLFGNDGAAASNSKDIPTSSPASAPAPTAKVVETHHPSLSLGPAVIMLKGKAGQSSSHELSISNNTSMAMEFDMEANDVVIEDGKRQFLPPGEVPGSIAKTATFSQKSIKVGPGETARVKVTVTVPEPSGPRAMAAIFHGKTVIGSRAGLAMTGSLGALITFTTSDQFQLERSAIQIAEQTSNTNLSISQLLTNTGSEPIIVKGVAAILNPAGKLVGKIPIDGHRLLPGERFDMKAEYPSTLRAGSYRALVSLQHEGGMVTSSSDFHVQ